MKEVRFHGRGGQGVVIAAQLLATAAFHEGRFSQASLSYTGERRGSPVLGYARISDNPIIEKSKIYNPDYVVLMDNKLLMTIDPFEGIKKNGICLINCSDPMTVQNKIGKNTAKIFTVDATRISEEVFGVKAIPIVNVSILGAFAAITKEVNPESISAVLDQFLPLDVIENNIRSARLGYENVKEMTGFSTK